MRVLMLHNRYRAPGGEERVVAAQAALLTRHGHTVEILERDSSTLGSINAARGLLGGGIHPAAVGDAVARFGADVVHAHNLHPSFGWRALAAARVAGARTVLQLHNFRLFCGIGIAYRAGAPCHACRGANTLPGVIHRCRGGVGEATVYAAGLAAQQQRLLGNVDRLIALSEAQLDLLAGHGLARELVMVVPNFVPDGGWAEKSQAHHGKYALVAGRLVEEKGFDTAVLAAKATGVPLVVAGTGPDEARLRRLAGDAPVTFRGWLEPPEMAALQAGAGLVLVPSRCEESFGYGVLDAFAAGVPVIASDRGGLAELARAGGAAVLDPDAPDAWVDALKIRWWNPPRRRIEGQRGMELVRERYGEQQALARLLWAYGAAG